MIKTLIQHNRISWLFFIVVAFSAVYLYIDFSHLWVSLGREKNLFAASIYYFEIPLMIVFLSFFYFPQIKNLLIRFILPLVPMVVLYAMFDGFYNYLGRSPSISDFQNLDSLWEVMPLVSLATFIIFLSIPGIFIFLLYRVYQFCTFEQFQRIMLFRLIFTSLFIFVFTTSWFENYHQRQFNYTVWSQEDTIRDNGRLSSFIYYYNDEKINRQKLLQFSNSSDPFEVQKTLYPDSINKKRNVHLVVLESFIDPREIENIRLSRPVIAEELLPYLINQKTFSLVTSPIYGGGTAQAEFELLTGVPALSRVNKIEFNVMKGGSIGAFAAALKENNYRTIATVATGTGFFNSKQAYQSLAFDQVDYLEEDKYFMANINDWTIFDGDLFEHNLKNLAEILPTSPQPVFNYVLGMYGHTPFIRNEVDRPDIALVTHPNEKVIRLTNQFYYRTRAIANYLQQLMALDKDAIIYLTSDHLPSILNDVTSYTRDNKTNIALFFDRGQNIDVSGKKYYELPWLIWDRLSEKKHKRNFDENKMETFYYQVLSQSIAEKSMSQ